MTVDVVVNPVHRGALHACARVQGLCARAGVPVTVRTTSIARPHADPSADARLTVVIGGDGTLREVAGALMDDDRWNGAILPVPTGTASLFALSVGVRSTAAGIALLEAYLTDAHGWALSRCDVGRAVIQRAGGEGASALPFLVSAGIGHSGGAILRTPRWAKTLFGAAGYGVGALGRLGAGPVSVRLQDDRGAPPAGDGVPAHVHDWVDPHEWVDLHDGVDDGVWAVEFGNITRIPSGITVFPHGGVRTGSLAGLLVSFPGEVVDEIPRPRQLWRRIPGWGRVFRAGFLGGHESVDELRLWTTQTARVVAHRPLAAHLDGESVGMVTGLRLDLVPAALPVIVPGSRDAASRGNDATSRTMRTATVQRPT